MLSISHSSLTRNCLGDLKNDIQFEEETLNLASRLASEHFITLADLCNRRQQGTSSWVLENQNFKQWLIGGFRSLYCVGPRKFSRQMSEWNHTDHIQPGRGKHFYRKWHTILKTDIG